MVNILFQQGEIFGQILHKNQQERNDYNRLKITKNNEFLDLEGLI